MWKENKVFKDDLDLAINASFVPWSDFANKTFFVTGATGLIGYTFTCTLLYYSLIKKSGIKVIALVRDIEKAKEQYQEALNDHAPLTFAKGSVEELPAIDEKIDSIVHGACPTASAFFTQHPVETIKTIIDGTENVLNFAKEKNVQSMVHLSSMEAFGEILTKEKLSENDLGKIYLTSPRSSYSEAKRLAENLCASYVAEYNVPVKVARLVQTFGPGVKYNDGRVFAYMMRCALENKNIELKTSGEKENSYLYTMDAVTAILVMLAKGENGKTYNVANEETYCSVKEMGRIVLDTFNKNELKVLTNVGNDKNSNTGFRPDGYLNVCVKSLEALGWKANTDLTTAYKKTAESF
jgi:UDP-glucuronate decarboxylase